MRAIDTNVVVRFLTVDDEEQSPLARSIMETGDIYLSLTVCLETEWVLRYAYRYTPEQIAAGLLLVVGLPRIEAEAPSVLSTAIEWLLAGMDFADALHLAKAEGCTAFISFDKKIAKAAKGRSPIPVEAP